MNLAIIQARMSSTRLPGKVIKSILGQPLLIRLVERVKRSNQLDNIVVATSREVTDDVIAELCEQHSIQCYRGSLEDVLDRFYQAASLFCPSNIIRITGDCPLVDPELIDKIIQFHEDGGFDYTSNTIEPTFPDGLDVEVFKYYCLKQAWQESKLPSEREHVTPFFYNNPQRFKLGNFKGQRDLSHLRWTVDNHEDFILVSRIYQELYPSNSNFTTKDILSFITKYPEVNNINSNFQRNEGYLVSLKNDLENQASKIKEM